MNWPGDYVNQIIQGDCLEVMKGIPDGAVDLIVADPPYGIDWACARRKPEDRMGAIAGDKSVDGQFLDSLYRVLRDSGAVYLFTRWDVLGQWQSLVSGSGFDIKSLIVWDKVVHGCGDLTGAWGPTHEMIIYATKGKCELQGNRPQDVIRQCRVMPNNLIHPCQKPVPLFYPIIKASSLVGDLVLDCYAGSGTTAVAAKILGRRFIGIELDPGYCEIARRRVAEAQEQQDMFRSKVQDTQSTLL